MKLRSKLLPKANPALLLQEEGTLGTPGRYIEVRNLGTYKLSRQNFSLGQAK
jgi:hypothetical protein